MVLFGTCAAHIVNIKIISTKVSGNKKKECYLSGFVIVDIVSRVNQIMLYWGIRTCIEVASLKCWWQGHKIILATENSQPHWLVRCNSCSCLGLVLTPLHSCAEPN